MYYFTKTIEVFIKDNKNNSLILIKKNTNE